MIINTIKLNKMEKIEKTYTNNERAKIDAMRFKVGFAPMREVIKRLRERNLPIYWEILYNSLAGGDLVEKYAKHFAETIYEDWDDIDIRNRYKRKFACLSTTSGIFFDKDFVKRFEDGSFDIDDAKIDNHFIDMYTYTFTDKQLKAIESVIDGLTELNIYPSVVNSYFYTANNGIQPIVSNLATMLKSK